MSELKQEQKKAWVATWKRAEIELDRIKSEELQTMDEATSAEIFNSLGTGWVDDWQNPERQPGFGLVQQQMYFSRTHAIQPHS